MMTIFDFCEKNDISQRFSFVGLKYFEENRQEVLSVGFLFTVVSFVCTLFACASLTESESITQVTSWSIGDGMLAETTETSVWAGLAGAVWSRTQGSTIQSDYILWSDKNCADIESDRHICGNCRSAGHTAFGLIMLAAVTRVPSFRLIRLRGASDGDHVVYKIFGVLSESLAAISMAGALFVWREYCHELLPHPNALNYRYGAGFVLVGFCLSLTSLLVVLHILLPSQVKPEIIASDKQTPRNSSNRSIAGNGSGKISTIYPDL